MCTGAEIIPLIAAVAGTASTGLAISQAIKGAPKVPAALQATKDPNVDAFRRKNGQSYGPGGFMAGVSSTAAGGTAGQGGSVGTSSLLGQ